MKITIEWKETPRGDMELMMGSEGAPGATLKERAYAVEFRKLLTEGYPVIAKRLGATATVPLTNAANG